jgi:SAM-dependent methyltransferase
MALDSLDPVCEFYTSHPYPPPVANLDRARDEWKDENRHRAEFHLLWPDQPYRADLEILIAGCGTWQAAKYALCRPDARIVGIDVSTTSLDHTERLKRQYNLTNLEILQLPIEGVAALERQFDLIVCTGVLHHLADPDAGLRALRSVLRPDGVMNLMVYASYGRSGIYMLQDYCRRLGGGTSAQEMEDLVAVLETLPPRHPLTALLSEARDFRNADALADALLNPRDRSYSVPQLFEFLERSGLTFGRWYLQAPYLPQCGAIAATPHATRLAALSEREQFAAMELWRGTIARHSVLARCREASGAGAKVGFDDARWRRYVPIRRPASICVKERLPAGAAGVLLNRSHAPHHDLILVINAEEKQMVDAIDGRRTIADIVDHVRSTAEYAEHAEKSRPANYASSAVDPLGARALFEKLWRYDQVVFDASTVAGTV